MAESCPGQSVAFIVPGKCRSCAKTKEVSPERSVLELNRHQDSTEVILAAGLLAMKKKKKASV